MIPKRYRKDYDGEFVITDTILRDGVKEQEREWVPNPIENKHMGRATCIADGISTEGFLFHTLEDHKGGLLASQAMQTYGVDDIHKKLRCNFLVSTNQSTLDEIKDSGYQEKTIVYTSASLCIKNEGEFFLIPHSVRSSSHAIALWLACFDEHKEIFLFGYDECDHDGKLQTKMITTVNEVMKAYDDVTYYFVHRSGNMPDPWRYHTNVKEMSVEEYVSYTDT